MSATTLPYLLGWVVQDELWRFTGFVVSIEDGNAFIAKMLSGTAGDWLFRTPYTAFPQQGFLIFLPYILLGKLAGAPGTHEKLVLLYHTFRFLAGLLAILATYDLIAFFVRPVRDRRLGLVLAVVGGGLGWLLVLLGTEKWLGSLPLDFYSPESFGFLSLYIYPHYALARALLLWGLLAYLGAAARPDGGTSLPAAGLRVGVLWLLAALTQPFTGMVAGMVVVIYLLVLAGWQLLRAARRLATDWPRLWEMAQLGFWAGLLPAPFILYNLVSSRLDPFLKQWTEQSQFASPHPLHYLLAYGLLLPLVIPGARRLWRAADWRSKLPVAWALALPALAYAPVSIQRRLPEGVWVALVVLAMAGLEGRSRRWAAFLALALPSTALLLLGGALQVRQPAEPAFRPAAEVAVFRCLAEQLDGRQAVVLSTYDSGNPLPAWAPAYVVLGHGPESVGFAETEGKITAFYQSRTTDDERLAWLQEMGIDYVFWGPHERALGAWDPGSASFLSPVCQAGDYGIYGTRWR